MDRRRFLQLSAGLLPLSLGAVSDSRPRIRAITAFIRIDTLHYQQQTKLALDMLHAAKLVFESAGYEVHSIRIVTQPFPSYIRGLSPEDARRFLCEYDELAVSESFSLNVGPAMLTDDDDPANAAILARVLSTSKVLNASLVTGSDAGVHWKCIAAAASTIKSVADSSPDSGGNFDFATTAMLGPYAPFFPGAYHTESGQRFTIGLQGAGIVDRAFGDAKGNVVQATANLRNYLEPHLVHAEGLAHKIELETSWRYMGLDPTPAPLKEVSVGAAIEKLTGVEFGSSGTMTAAAAITAALRDLPIKRIGYSGLMLPILEDSRLAQRWNEAAFGVDALLAYSAVCATGLDTIPLPGNIATEQLARMLGDVATLACKWKKPLAARLMPVKGKHDGDFTEFNDPYLVNARIRSFS